MEDELSGSVEPERRNPARWPRLMSTADAAEYLSLGRTTVREKGPAPIFVGRRRLYDIRALDRWADRLSDQPLSERDEELEALEVESRFFERLEAAKRSTVPDTGPARRNST